jgi:hypothetical protein
MKQSNRKCFLPAEKKIYKTASWFFYILAFSNKMQVFQNIHLKHYFKSSFIAAWNSLTGNVFCQPKTKRWNCFNVTQRVAASTNVPLKRQLLIAAAFLGTFQRCFTRLTHLTCLTRLTRLIRLTRLTRLTHLTHQTSPIRLTRLTRLTHLTRLTRLTRQTRLTRLTHLRRLRRLRHLRLATSWETCASSTPTICLRLTSTAIVQAIAKPPLSLFPSRVDPF